ncbi:alpha/beta fold hydrolase [Nocardia farcinica]|uniref:alpha/beta fold hydrolase n=1 Tax=Nocardia farcinica TaxID=37329 RepID=UPI002457EE49|nr:alpha/beta fold hydrolase [Nocardia farcinica]
MAVLRTPAGPVGYTDDGTGPALVFVHGFLFDKRMWAPQVARFTARGYRVITVDMVGFGASTATSTTVPMGAHSAALAAVLAACDVDTVVLTGYSMGGQVALDFVAAHPGRVRALVLSDTFAGLDSAEVKASRFALADRLAADGVADYAEEFLPLVLSPRTVAQRPAVAERARTMMRAADPAGAAAALRGRAERRDYTGVARTLDVPALVIVGAEDQFDRGVLGADLAATIPDAHLTVIDEAGHTPNMERPEAFDDALAAFLDSLARVG